MEDVTKNDWKALRELQYLIPGFPFVESLQDGCSTHIQGIAVPKIVCS